MLARTIVAYNRISVIVKPPNDLLMLRSRTFKLFKTAANSFEKLKMTNVCNPNHLVSLRILVLLLNMVVG